MTLALKILLSLIPLWALAVAAFTIFDLPGGELLVLVGAVPLLLFAAVALLLEIWVRP